MKPRSIPPRISTFAKLTKGASWKDCNWWTLCMNATYYQEFALETKDKVIDSNSVTTSNPIKITYIGYDQGEVSINSIGNVLLAGLVSDLGGNTAITSSQGSITQKNKEQLQVERHEHHARRQDRYRLVGTVAAGERSR